MTELEIMQRAKMYMDKLANGINPLNDCPVPDGELLQNVRISRCFFYVSDILRQVIENGGTVRLAVRASAARTPKAPFSITREQLDAFPFSDRPVSVSEFVRRINELVPEVMNDTMNKFKFSSVTAFLMETGFLTEAERPDGKKTKRPTEAGESLGILTEDRFSTEGYRYTMVLYNRDAQRFLVDNMDAILAMGG